MPRLSPFAASLTLVLLACGGAEAPPAADRGALTEPTGDDEPGSTRASREAVAPGAAGSQPDTPAAPPEVPPLTVRFADVVEAEDGRGATVATARALVFDVRAAGLSGRALDPTLTVGELELSRYRHPAVGVLRFSLAAEQAPLADGAEVSVRHGDDRRVLTQSLVLP